MMRTNDNSLLLINDVTGYGRVSTFAMTPILATYGLHPYILATGLVSNTLDYGKSEILDTTLFMRNAITKWDELGFKFSNIATGFINSDEQVDIICELIAKQDDPWVLVDPIMADSGALYDNMYEGAIECNRRLATVADVIIPNYTEATMLADLYIGRDTLSRDEYIELGRAIKKLGARNVVVTSCRLDDSTCFNLVVDENGSTDFLSYEETHNSFIGTGDVFSAVLVSELLNGSSLKDAVNFSGSFVKEVIEANSDREDHFDLYIEGSLPTLYRRQLSR